MNYQNRLVVSCQGSPLVGCRACNLERLTIVELLPPREGSMWWKRGLEDSLSTPQGVHGARPEEYTKNEKVTSYVSFGQFLPDVEGQH